MLAHEQPHMLVYPPSELDQVAEPVHGHDVPEPATELYAVPCVELGPQAVQHMIGECAGRKIGAPTLVRRRKWIGEFQLIPVRKNPLRALKAPRSQRDMRIGLEVGPDGIHDERATARCRDFICGKGFGRRRGTIPTEPVTSIPLGLKRKCSTHARRRLQKCRGFVIGDLMNVSPNLFVLIEAPIVEVQHQLPKGNQLDRVEVL
jgi:hypothetical protein